MNHNSLFTPQEKGSAEWSTFNVVAEDRSVRPGMFRVQKPEPARIAPMMQRPRYRPSHNLFPKPAH